MSIELITDRDANDVARWRELRNKGWEQMTAAERDEWAASMKGAYDYTDLNRVENAVAAIASMLGVSVETVTTWSPADLPTEANTARFLANIRKLRTVCQGLSNTPTTPSNMHRMTYVTANNIEKILADIETVIYSWTRCGELYCGE